MKNGHIMVIAGFLIILALLGFSYYGKNAPTPSTQDKQTPVNSVAPAENKAPVSSTAPTEKEAAVSPTATDKSPASPGSSINPENNVTKNSAATPETQAAVEDKAPLSSAAAIEQAQKNGESMWLLFRSSTCIPCVEMQKIFDQLQSDYKGKVRFISIDVNDKNNTALVKNWRIQYIPTTFIIDSTGKVNYQNIGVIPIEDLKKELNKVVK